MLAERGAAECHLCSQCQSNSRRHGTAVFCGSVRSHPTSRVTCSHRIMHPHACIMEAPSLNFNFPSVNWDSSVRITLAHCCLVHSRWRGDQARWAAWCAWVRGGQTAGHLEQVLLSWSWLWKVWSPKLTQPAAHSSTLSTFAVAVLFLRHVRTINLSCCLVVDLGHPMCLLSATLGADKCLSVFEQPSGSYKTSCNFCTATPSLSHASTHYCWVVFFFFSPFLLSHHLCWPQKHYSCAAHPSIPTSSHTHDWFCIAAPPPKVHRRRCQITGGLPSKGDTVQLRSHFGGVL